MYTLVFKVGAIGLSLSSQKKLQASSSQTFIVHYLLNTKLLLYTFFWGHNIFLLPTPGMVQS